MAVPEAVRPLLDGLVSLVHERFPKRLEGISLIGSLAHGTFSPRLSDVDVCVVLADPPEEADSPALVGVAGELAEGYPRFGPRLSLYWATPAVLRGEASGGRLGIIDTADLAQHGLLQFGSDARELVRPLSRAELRAALQADLSERWRRRMAPFNGRDALENGRGAELDERTLIKTCLYPARFLVTAESGRIVGCDAAAAAFVARYGEPCAPAVELAVALRQRSAEATPAEREVLAAAFVPLYALFFAELKTRFGIDMARA